MNPEEGAERTVVHVDVKSSIGTFFLEFLKNLPTSRVFGVFEISTFLEPLLGGGPTKQATSTAPSSIQQGKQGHD